MGAPVRHLAFFGRDRARIAEPGFVTAPGFVGAQLKYLWRELEPEPGKWAFDAIRQDRERLRGSGKGLWVQLQDATFAPQFDPIPPWLRADPRYRGGAAQQWNPAGDGAAQDTPGGWVARRWDPAVRARFHALLAALGRAFDGTILGINLPETAIDFGTGGAHVPSGFTPARYRDAVLETLAALRRSFPKTVALQYANFMPGEWLPGDDRGYLKSVYRKAAALGVGLGAPDLLPGVRGQENHAYPLLRAATGRVPTAIAVQDGNYSRVSPRTGRRPTVSELLAYACDDLKVGTVFWGAEEPFFTEEVVPSLRRA